MPLTTTIHQSLISFISGFDDFTSNLSFLYAKNTFSKTKKSLHISFLKSCIRSKVIPKGMILRHTPSDRDNLRLTTSIDKILFSSSLTIMRAHISSLAREVQILNNRISCLKQQISRLLNPVLALTIKNRVHDLNRELFLSLQTTKDHKFARLSPHSFHLTSAFSRDQPSTSAVSSPSSSAPPSSASFLDPISTSVVLSHPVSSQTPTVSSLDLATPTLTRSCFSYPPCSLQGPQVHTSSVTHSVVTAASIASISLDPTLSSGSTAYVPGPQTGSPGSSQDSLGPLDQFPSSPCLAPLGSHPAVSVASVFSGGPLHVLPTQTHAPSLYHPTPVSPVGPRDSRSLTASPAATSHDLRPTPEVHYSVHCIPEDLPLSTAERSILSRGLNFIPLLPTADKPEMMCFFNRFFFGQSAGQPSLVPLLGPQSLMMTPLLSFSQLREVLFLRKLSKLWRGSSLRLKRTFSTLIPNLCHSLTSLPLNDPPFKPCDVELTL